MEPVLEVTCNAEIIFYNAETRTKTKVMKKDLDSFGTSCYCYMLGIRKTDKVEDEEVLKRVRKIN